MTDLTWEEKQDPGGLIWWEMTAGDMCFWMQKRPPHCDRGRYIVNVDIKNFIAGKSTWMDEADCFPRYYFDFETAKKEVTEFAKRRLPAWP